MSKAKVFMKALLVSLVMAAFCCQAAFAVSVSPSTTTVTLPKGENQITFNVILQTESNFAGAEFGLKPSADDVTFGKITYINGFEKESTVKTVKDGVLYFGFFSGSNKFAADRYQVAEVTYNYSGTGTRTISLVSSKVVMINADGKTTSADTSAKPFTVTVKREGAAAGGGGGGGSAAEEIVIDAGAGGSAAANPKQASKGDKVEITVTPDSGKTVDTITVTDQNGKEITSEKTADNKYSFTMPTGAVKVKITFKDKAAGSGRFIDVADNAWYHDAVYFVADKGYFNGTSENMFSPDDPMTRAMFVTVIGRLAGVDASQYQTSNFSDVQAGSWYAPYVAWAAEKGVVKGISETEFDPNGKITREQMAAMMYRYADFCGVNLTDASSALFDRFADKAAVSQYAEKAMIWATDKGIINGTEKGLEPAADATRAQVAQIIKNYVEKIK